MSKLDKKIISIFVVFLLLVSFIMPNITLAATNEVIIKDSALKEDILSSVDANRDGKLSEEEIKNLTYVSIDDKVESISGLEYATNLATIHIEYTGKNFDFSKCNLANAYVSISLKPEITNIDLSFLKTIKNLESVAFNGNLNNTNVNIDYSILNDIPTLCLLDIYGKDILPNNMNDIYKLKNISYLSLSGNDFTNKASIDLKGISNMSQLTGINLSVLKINNASELGKLTKLTYFNVSSVEGMGDFSYLTPCKNLQDVSISLVNEIDLNFLKNKDSVKSLGIINGKPKNINAIATLKNLEYLWFHLDELNGAEQYNNFNFKDYTAYLGENNQIQSYFSKFAVSSSSLFTYKSNNDIVTISDDGLFTANKIGEATITATAKNEPSVKKTFKIKVNGIAANQALGTQMGSSFVNGETVLKANGELWKIYGDDAKAEKIATNVKKAVYSTVYGEDLKAFPYALLLKNDGKLQYEFNGVTSVITDAKDIYENGYLKKDGTYVEIQIDGSWKTITDNVEKIVGSYLVKSDGKTYTVKNKLICNFPIVAANYNLVIDKDGVIWNVNNSTAPMKVRDNFDSFISDTTYKDKDGKVRELVDGREVDYKKTYGDLTLKLDNNLYLGNKEILTSVSDIQDLIEVNTMEILRQLILRTDGSIWTLTLNGEGKLVKLEEKENIYFKQDTLKTKTVYDDFRIPVLTGFNVKNLEISKALASSNFQTGYTAKAYDGKEELKGGSKLFTGATVKIYNKEGKVVNEFVALVYGDVTCTGSPSAKDALMIIKNKTGKAKIPTSLQLEAARITKNTRKTGGEPTAADALAIVKAKLGKYTIEG